MNRFKTNVEVNKYQPKPEKRPIQFTCDLTKVLGITREQLRDLTKAKPKEANCEELLTTKENETVKTEEIPEKQFMTNLTDKDKEKITKVMTSWKSKSKIWN
jgi:hypothetical protein